MTSTAKRVVLGSSSRNSPSRFPASRALVLTVPVTFPPGRLKLPTSPSATGSPPVLKTIGIVVVSLFAASAACVVPGVAINGNLQADQIGRKFRQSIVALRRPAVLDCNVAPFDIASFAQTFAEGRTCLTLTSGKPA